MKPSFNLQQPHIRAKIIGFILIAIGIGFLINPTALNIKIAFTAVLIGIFIIFMITERSIPKNISNAHIEGNLETVKNIIRELNLTGNAVFLPKSDILTQERAFIPLNNSNIKIPNVDDDLVFATGSDGKSLGISIPPSGLKLLHEIEKETNFKYTELEGVEEKLQTFVGLNLLKSISLKKEEKNSWKLELEKPIFCTYDTNLCKQYPCPTCSAALTAITRAGNQKIWIQDTIHNGKKTTFHLTTGE